MDRYLWVSHLKTIYSRRRGHNALKELVHGVKGQEIIRRYQIDTSIGCLVFADELKRLSQDTNTLYYLPKAAPRGFKESIIAIAMEMLPDFNTLETIIPNTGRTGSQLYGGIILDYNILHTNQEILNEFEGYSLRDISGNKILAAEVSQVESNKPFYVFQSARSWTPITRLLHWYYNPQRAIIPSLFNQPKNDEIMESFLYFNPQTGELMD